MLNNQSIPLIEFSKTEIEATIIERFIKVVNIIPNNIAVVSPEGSFTFSELDHVSNQIAEVLLEKKNSHEKLIGLLIDQTHLAIAAILGVLKTGNGFVVFSPEAPVEQLQLQWKDALEPIILTDVNHLIKTKQLTTNLINLSMQPISLIESNPIREYVNSSDLAAVFYTSGSTGQPKGVMWSHQLVLHTAYQNLNSYQLTCQDHFAIFASFGFGMAMTQTFAALLSGACLHFYNIKTSSLSKLFDWLNTEEITIIAMPPIGLFRQLMDYLSNRPKLSRLRLVLLGGDAFFKEDLNLFRACFKSSTLLVYRFGGSETMLISELKISPETIIEDDKIPVGYQIPDKEILILDNILNPVPVNFPGEIAVRSRYLATGYWQNPQLTAELFLKDPEQKDQKIYLTGDLACIDKQGQLIHLGRKDFLVKIRGFSVQLEAVESALLKLDIIQQAVVTTFQPPASDLRLAAYIITSKGIKVSSSSIRQQLEQILPSHMIPSIFTKLDEFPVTATGKVDRNALPIPSGLRPELNSPYAPPQSDLELQLCNIWEELLSISPIGVEDDFFELGGDSLLSLQVSLIVEKKFNQRVPTFFFEQPTISNLIRCMKQEGTIEESLKKEFTQDASFPIKDNKEAKPNYRGRPLFIRGKSLRVIYRNLKTFLQIPFFIPLLHLTFQQCFCLINWLLDRTTLLSIPFSRGFYYYRKFIKDSKFNNRMIIKKYTSLLKGNLYRFLFIHSILDDEAIKLTDRFHLSPFRFWRSLGMLIETAPIEILNNYFSVTGLELLKLAQKESHGVIILAYHSSVNRLAIAALPRRLDGEYIQTISQKIARQKSSTWKADLRKNLSENKRGSLYAGEALHGQYLLEQGRIIQLVSDPLSDETGYASELAGKQYFLKTGFAELALNTGARIIPQFSTITDDGRIHTTFFPALITLNSSRSEQIDDLMTQYITFINSCWKNAPESLYWSRIRHHLSKK